MTTDFPTAPSAYGLKGPSATVTVEKSIHASHTEILTTPVLDLQVLNQLTIQFEKLAAKHNAIYDGWGAEIVE